MFFKAALSSMVASKHSTVATDTWNIANVTVELKF